MALVPGQDPLPPALASVPAGAIESALHGGGLWIDFGAAVLRVRGDAPGLAAQLQSVYRCHPFLTQAEWADLHVRLERPPGLRRWLRPQVVFESDGRVPFEPFPADTALPLLEWGTNWLIGQRLNHLLLLHSGVVEKGGRAMVLPALPGSGKSTLTAALSLSGWRLLSDEFGAFDPDQRVFRALLKPAALKNASIEVIRRFSARASLGPEFPKTRKGTVAHLAADETAVRRRHEAAVPGAVVLPRWQAGSPTRLEPLAPQAVFGALAFNAFNYKVLGAAGFDAVVHLARTCPAYQLIYGDLHDAISRLDELWASLP